MLGRCIFHVTPVFLQLDLFYSHAKKLVLSSVSELKSGILVRLDALIFLFSLPCSTVVGYLMTSYADVEVMLCTFLCSSID